LCGGIAKMRTRHFLAAVRRNHATLARKVLRPVYLFETRKLLWLGRVLKIRVSVVRFRPWPPLLTLSSSELGVFRFCGPTSSDAAQSNHTVVRLCCHGANDILYYLDL
jgi:hypothetical protein